MHETEVPVVPMNMLYCTGILKAPWLYKSSLVKPLFST